MELGPDDLSGQAFRDVRIGRLASVVGHFDLVAGQDG
jgi:hypothetical protein